MAFLSGMESPDLTPDAFSQKTERGYLNPGLICYIIRPGILHVFAVKISPTICFIHD
jgi:hypothetical protein